MQGGGAILPNGAHSNANFSLPHLESRIDSSLPELNLMRSMVPKYDKYHNNNSIKQDMIDSPEIFTAGRSKSNIINKIVQY